MASETHVQERPSRFSPGRVWAFARREAVELQHDSVRLAFTLFGPILLMIVLGYGISLDVDHLLFAVLDPDATPSSRLYADSLRGSYYFVEHTTLLNYGELDRRLRNGELCIALELPPSFQRDLQRGRQPAVHIFLDAAQPFRAETTCSYVENAHDQYLARLRAARGAPSRLQDDKVSASHFLQSSLQEYLHDGSRRHHAPPNPDS